MCMEHALAGTSTPKEDTAAAKVFKELDNAFENRCGHEDEG